MEILDEHYWSGRYEKGQTGWDIGYPAPAIQKYIDQLEDKNLSILIPGAGNAYEAEYLWLKGFKGLEVIDLSAIPLLNFSKRVPSFPKEQLIQGNFFKHDQKYDLIIEQTFFCALNPSLREAYLQKMSELLKPNGRLVGLLFNIPLYDDHPPFGGSIEEYLPLFNEYLRVIKMEKAMYSIPPREGNELWFVAELKSEL